MSWKLDPERNEVRAVFDLVDLADKDILEIGCGDGRLTWRYAERTASILAIDPKADEIAAAEAACPAALRQRVTFRAADITTLELPPATFDVALFSWSL